MATSNNKTISCPECGETIALVPKTGNPHRLIASHACKGLGLRPVYETDAPSFPPPVLQDRLEPSEGADVKRKPKQ